MIAALIAVISIAALLQFFISYCRSIIATSKKLELSEQVREATGVGKQPVGAEEFGRLLQLVRLCPTRGDDQMDIRLVSLYFRLLNLLRGIGRTVSNDLAGWSERERQTCSYFAAVVLDRRIAYSRELLAQQMSDRG